MFSLLPILIIFAATLAQSTLGFGLALVAMPLLTLILSLQTTAPLVALVGTTTGLIIVAQDWREIDLIASWRLILAAIAGVPVGLWVLVMAPPALVTRVLGVLLILYSLYQLLRPSLMTLPHSGWAYLCGFIAGVLGGAYNIGGPPIVIYGTLRRWLPLRFRATLQSYFLAVGLFVLAGHAWAGLWTAEVWRLFLLSLPGMFLATFLGRHFNQRLPTAQFERLLYVALIGLGALLLR